MRDKKLHISIVIASLRTGGAERAMMNLAHGFNSKGIKTDIVLIEKTGELIPLVKSGVIIHDLNKKQARYGIMAFRRYLKRLSPDVLIVTQLHVQLMVIAAIRLSGWNGILILNEQSTFSINSQNKFKNYLASIAFKRANAITIVSGGSSKDFISEFPSLKNKIFAIPNPVYLSEINLLKNEKVNHPFLNDKKFPVILSAGRLSASKNFALLIDAFYKIQKETNARLIILGEGNERSALEKKAEELNLTPYVSLPGNVDNPYSFMNLCDVFTLTSDYEGLPTVLIEALACGCKIVSTDCPHGPAEILDHGKYGTLVPLHNDKLFSEEILISLRSENNKEEKIIRAGEYGIELITGKYLELINNLIERG